MNNPEIINSGLNGGLDTHGQELMNNPIASGQELMNNPGRINGGLENHFKDYGEVNAERSLINCTGDGNQHDSEHWLLCREFDEGKDCGNMLD